VLPDVVNALLLVFVLSAANSGKYVALLSYTRELTKSADIYVASRTLFGLAKDGQAPRFLPRPPPRVCRYTEWHSVHHPHCSAT